MPFHIEGRIVLRALLAALACQAPLSPHAEPGIESDSATTPLGTCILSTLDLRKADELGQLVAASGKHWVKSPSGGVADPHRLRQLDSADPAQIEAFTAANGAEDLIREAQAEGADKCGIDEDEFELAGGAVLTLEHSMGPADFLKGMTTRVQETVAAFRTIRKTLLNSREFQRSYQRALAEREVLKKREGS